MTEKELRKLKRSDFLQLLLAQSKDLTAVQARLDEASAELERLRALNEELNARLGEKEELINDLRGRLEGKEATIRASRREIEDMKAIMRLVSWDDPGKDGSRQSLDEFYEAVRGTISDEGRKNRRRGRKAMKNAKNSAK